MATADDIRATIAAYPERMTAGDKDGWLALFTDDATVEDPVGSEVRVGRDAVAGFWDFTRTLSSAIELTIAGPVCVAGNEAAFPIRIVTTMGTDRFLLDAIDVMTFADDGRIATMRAFWDMADMRPYDGT